MSDRGGKPDPSSDADAELSTRLRDLGRQIGERRISREEPAAEDGPKDPNLAVAWRLSADFIAAVVLGAALGWGIDRLFGTLPWGLVVFLLLGFAAGTLNVMRSAGLTKPGPGDPGKGR